MMTAEVETAPVPVSALRVGAWVRVEEKPLVGQVREQAADGLWWVRFPVRSQAGLPWTEVKLPAVLLTEVPGFTCPCSHHHQDNTSA